MGLTNTFEVCVKVYIDVEASNEQTAAMDAEDELRGLLREAPAYFKIESVRQATNYR